MCCFLSARRVDWGSCSCQHASTRVSSRGTGFDGAAQQTPRGETKKGKKYTNISQTASVMLLKLRTTIRHHHLPLALSAGYCQREGRGGGVWQVTAVEWVWQSLVTLNREQITISNVKASCHVSLSGDLPACIRIHQLCSRRVHLPLMITLFLMLPYNKTIGAIKYIFTDCDNKKNRCSTTFTCLRTESSDFNILKNSSSSTWM